MVDILGTTAKVGDRRLVAGVVRVASAGRLRILTAAGDVVVCDDADTLRVGDVVALAPDGESLPDRTVAIFDHATGTWVAGRAVETDAAGALAAHLDAGGFRLTNLGAAAADADAVRRDYVAAAVRAERFALADQPMWGSHGLTGWSGASSGSGTSYVLNRRYFSHLQAEPRAFATAEAGGDTSGTPARATFTASPGDFLFDGAVLLMEVSVTNSDNAEAFRIGFCGNAPASPSAVGRPSVMVGLEFDPATDATNWAIVVSNGSTTATSATTAAVPNAVSPVTYAILYQTTAIRAYVVTSAGVTQIGSTISTSIPSGDEQRAGRRFWQAEKSTTLLGSSRPHCQVGRFCFAVPAGDAPVLPTV